MERDSKPIEQFVRRLVRVEIDVSEWIAVASQELTQREVGAE